MFRKEHLVGSIKRICITRTLPNAIQMRITIYPQHVSWRDIEYRGTMLNIKLVTTFIKTHTAFACLAKGHFVGSNRFAFTSVP